ncbi:conserved hypothetical protein [Ricinus communis]|uniref:Uncharacterized protein n=1 Tax=Ricinus communis TaxID=3988 RepID=B9SZG5_RICCO|nr:conserved hypothetical protein [Ricinus communis]
MQEARNLSMKVELLIQEQTHSTNYRRYGGIDNRTLSDKREAPFIVSNTMENTNVGVEKGKGEAIKGGKGNNFMPAKNNNPYTKPFSAKCHKCGEAGHHSNDYPKTEGSACSGEG